MNEPTTTDPRALLDALDEAHTKATPGPWEADGFLVLPGYWGDTPPVLARTNDNTDAAAIVAAHNALPALTAAVRAGLALADVWDGIADTWQQTADHPNSGPTHPPTYRSSCLEEVADFRARAAALRATVTAALTGGTP
jgi:hypothetical protein